MRRSGSRFVVAVLAALVLAGACGGDDDDDSAARRTGQDVPPESTVPTESTLAPGTESTVAGGGGEGAPTTARRATATTRAGAATTSPPATSPPPPAPAGVKFTAPGKYTYDAQGTTPFGPPGPVTVTFDPPNGADQRAASSSNQGNGEQILRYQTDGAYLVFLKTPQPAEEFRPNPPVLAAPQPAPVGRTWSWTITSTDGDTTVKSDFRVTGNETVLIGGEQVPTVVVEATITVNSPQVAATIKRTMWISDNYRLIVKERNVVDSTRPIVSHSDVTATLRSTKPS